MGATQAKVKKSDLAGWKLYACDFETTTGTYNTEKSKVWSFCVDEVGRYDPAIYGSIEDFFKFCADPLQGIKKRLWFHNLQFDGQFILWHLQNVLHFRTQLNHETGEMEKVEKLCNGEMCYLISDMGQWYYIGFMYHNILVEIRDSLKVLPFTLKQIGEAFCTKYKKSTMEYDEKTSLNDCTPEDIDYIKNDVLVLSEALSFIMKLNGEDTPFMPVTSLTIGGACLQEFKQTNYGDNKNIMCKLQEFSCELNNYVHNADQYVRQAYRGGYCYVKRELEGVTIDEHGFTADINSLYPYIMCYEFSGSRFPYGKPVFRLGKPEQKLFDDDNYYFYMRCKVSFVLKPDHVPTIQKKHSLMFIQNVYLESSAIMDFRTKEYKGDPLKVEMWFSKDDFILFCEHYKILEIEYLDYMEFMTCSGIFDEYIKKFAKIKMESTGAIRSFSKLAQNTIYGQLSKSTNSSYKILTGKNGTDGGLEFKIIEGNNKKPVNIAIGACITAKARRYQIETIQNNLSRFCYSDTDSLHCIGQPTEFVGKVDNKIYGAYKIENEWNKARFVRQKTYIEELVDGSLNICSAGMTSAQKQKFREQYGFDDFKVGLTIHGGKLKPKLVEGGVILEETDFTIR